MIIVLLYVLIIFMVCFLIGLMRAGGLLGVVSYFLFMLCGVIAFPLVAIWPKLYTRIIDRVLEIGMEKK